MYTVYNWGLGITPSGGHVSLGTMQQSYRLTLIIRVPKWELQLFVCSIPSCNFPFYNLLSVKSPPATCQQEVKHLQVDFEMTVALG